MATGGNIHKTSGEKYGFICTSCAADDFIKEALKYCVDCQQYFCKDCLVLHRRIQVSKGHSLLDNSAVKPQGHTRSLPAFPTKQCSKHAGKFLDMYCMDHNDLCCYVCAAEDHRSCDDMVSVSDNIDQLYDKTDSSETASYIARVLNEIKRRQIGTDVLLQRLRASKETAIKDANDFRLEMEQLIKELEEESIKEINDEYKKLESQILNERKIYEDYIKGLNKINQQLSQASGNLAQQFVCSKFAEINIKSIETSEIYSSGILNAEVIFQSNEELKTSFGSMTSLGNTTSRLRHTKLYKVEKLCDMNVGFEDDNNFCHIFGSCIINDTVLFSDNTNERLSLYEIYSSSLLDYCKMPDGPLGICNVDNTLVAVACVRMVQFVTINDNKLSLSRSFDLDHCFGCIAYKDDKLYIPDKDLYSINMYDMEGILLKTVYTDNDGQYLFRYCSNITLSDYNDRLFVADSGKGLVCFNTECDYIETITDTEIKPTVVCVDGSGNIIVANESEGSIVQCDRDGHKIGVIVNTAERYGSIWSVCIHPRLNRMFVGTYSNEVQIYQLH